MLTLQKLLREIGDQMRKDILAQLHVDILNRYKVFTEHDEED